MKVDLNPEANSNNELFYLSNNRAGAILDHMAIVCTKAVVNFDDYQRIAAVYDDIKYRVDIYKVLTEMLSIAETEDEKSYILFCAYTGIRSIDEAVLQQAEEEDD